MIAAGIAGMDESIQVARKNKEMTLSGLLREPDALSAYLGAAQNGFVIEGALVLHYSRPSVSTGK